jgi:tetratricopeptide (TPR) repeat protein
MCEKSTWISLAPKSLSADVSFHNVLFGKPMSKNPPEPSPVPSDTTDSPLLPPAVVVTASSLKQPAQHPVDFAQNHNLVGRRLTNEGRYREAVAELSQAIRLQADFALAYNARGYAWCLLHNYTAANDDLTRAIQLNPNYTNAYQLRAVVRRALGDISAADADAQRAEELSR